MISFSLSAFFAGEYDSYINGIDPCDVSEERRASDVTASATSSSSISSASSPNFEFQGHDSIQYRNVINNISKIVTTTCNTMKTPSSSKVITFRFNPTKMLCENCHGSSFPFYQIKNFQYQYCF